MKNRIKKMDLWKKASLALILCIIASFVFLRENNFHANEIFDPFNETRVFNPPRMASEYSGIGLARNVTEFGEGSFQNYNLNVTNNDTASIIAPDYWSAKEITGNISKIFEYDHIWMNNTFDIGIDSSAWTLDTDEPERVEDYIDYGWYEDPVGTNDSIYLTMNHLDTGDWYVIDTYLNYTFDFDRENIPNTEWEIDFNYRFLTDNNDWLVTMEGGSKVICAIEIDGDRIEFGMGKPSDHKNDTWYQDIIAPFSIDLSDLNPPGTMSILFGIRCKVAINPTGYLSFFVDNITLNIPNIPKPSQIGLNITDVSHGYNSSVNNINGYGSGIVTLENDWEGEPSGKTHFFSFSSNSSGEVMIDLDFYVKAFSLKKSTTELGGEGCEFIVENNTQTTWTTYFAVIIPGTYSENYYFNISKPINWNVTHLFDPYGDDKIDEIITTAGYGNATAIIPNEIILNGIWKIVADSPNYVNEPKIYRKNGLEWELNSTFQNFDTMKINGSINTEITPNIDQTNASLLIYYPNETLWYQSEDITIETNGNFESSEIIIGPNNASVGEYHVHLHWNNNDLNMSQVGLKHLTFTVYHETILKRESSFLSNKIAAFSGDVILLKVNYTDIDTDMQIDGANVNYTMDNATTIKGMMAYQGGGIYFAEVHTEGLQLGIYNVTVSATKPYYEAQNNIKLFEIEIQLYTSLERYESPTFVEFNDNATVKFRYKDSYDVGITNATVGLSINQNYILSIEDVGDGNYTVKFNVACFCLLGTQIIIFNFSSTGYETQLDAFQFQLIPQDVNIRVYINSNEVNENELIPTHFNDQLNISVRIFAFKEDKYLNGGLVTLLSENHEEILNETPSTYFQSSLMLSLSNFSLGTNYIDIAFQQQNYTTSSFTFQVLINQIDIDVDTIGFQDSIEKHAGEKITVKVKLTESGTEVYVDNASIILSWRYGIEDFNYSGNGIYELEFTIPNNIQGSQLITLIISFGDISYKTTEFTFFLDIIDIPQPNPLFWIIVTILLITISVLGSLSLRSYVYLPYKRRKLLDLLRKTQRYKDIQNIETIVVSDKTSGLPFYIKTYYALEHAKKELLSGFIYAITSISTEIVRNEKIEAAQTDFKKSMSIVKMIELDFKQFYFLISDYKELRLVFILKERASERFKSQAKNLLLALDLQLSDEIENWNGDLKIFNETIPPILEGYFELYYKEYFKLDRPNSKNIPQREREFTKMENRIINVIESITKTNDDFYLAEIVETIDEKNKTLVIEAIESLIEKKLIIPS